GAGRFLVYLFSCLCALVACMLGVCAYVCVSICMYLWVRAPFALIAPRKKLELRCMAWCVYDVRWGTAPLGRRILAVTWNAQLESIYNLLSVHRTISFPSTVSKNSKKESSERSLVSCHV